ncbi:MAG: hypothetical protein Q9219_003543 [cf. Caloplaca sp. 3 TL-2023]
MDPQLSNEPSESRSAPWSTVPQVPVVGIEHPCAIRNLGRAIDTLGGSEAVSELIGEASASIEAQFRFLPGNRERQPIPSFNSKTSNVLLKITVPKRTGRKRKRGSENVSFESEEPPGSTPTLISDPDDAQRLVRSMQDNPDRYLIEVVGSVKQTHRFRRLPDFAWSSENSQFMDKMRKHILPFQYSKLKDFKFDMSKGVQEKNDLPPPPQWTRHAIPFNYTYHWKTGTNRPVTSADLRSRVRTKVIMLAHDAPSVPLAPPSDLAPEFSLVRSDRNLIAAIREIFTHRPICTRRVVQNMVPADIWKGAGYNGAKYLWQYVGYIWISGAWRDTICAFGVDPRKDKEMRLYQTAVFQVESDLKETDLETTKSKVDRELAAKAEVRDGHLFDGHTVRLDGKVWQMCDISDPLLNSIINMDTIRDDCDTLSDGWYLNGTWSKIRVIMKAKVIAILAGNNDDEKLEDELLRLHQKVPELLTEQNRGEAIFERGTASSRLTKLAENVRVTATRPGGRNAAWGPETAKQRTDIVSAMAKKAAMGRRIAKRTEGRGSRGRRRGAGTKNEKAKGRKDVVDEQDMIDPRLRSVAGDLEVVEREAALKAFEDEAKDSEEEDSGDENDDSPGNSSDIGSSDSEEVMEEEEEEQQDEEQQEDVEEQEDTNVESSESDDSDSSDNDETGEDERMTTFE